MSIKTKQDYLAKPSGINLNQHIENVISEADHILEVFKTAKDNYDKNYHKSLYKRVRGAIKFHDDGKMHDQWQTACRNDHHNYIIWKRDKNSHKTSFRDYEQEVRRNASKYIRNANIRHEIYSLILHKNGGFSLPVQVAIAAHHGKLSLAHQHRWKELGEEAERYFEKFLRLNNKFIDHKDFKDALLEYLQFAGPRAFLAFADQNASIRESGEKAIELNEFKYSFPEEWDKRPVQQLAERNWRNDCLLMRAPTGAGKTEAALLWAKQQIEHSKAERLVIAMPTRFTSNSLEIDISKNISDTGIYHSSALFSKFIEDSSCEYLSELSRTNTTEKGRLLLSPASVTTIDHLLQAFTLTREDHHLVLQNLSNSCLVIDEADFYDDFVQANIDVLLKALKEWQVPVLIMSATLPDNAIKKYQKNYSVSDNIIEDRSAEKQIKFELRGTVNDGSDDLEHVLYQCIEEGAGIIYANTVARAMEYFNWFRERKITPMLYHSRFTEKDKVLKEKELKNNLGKKAWEYDTASGIAIMTQIGEMSVNISADIMVTDICPADRLIQRAGRLARFDDDKIGKLFVVQPLKDEALYPAPYGKFSKSGWIANDALIETNQRLQNKQYSNSQLVELVNEVYSAHNEYDFEAKQNAKELKNLFVANWLVSRGKRSYKDDNETPTWKSRNITQQETIFTELRNIHFNNYGEFNLYKMCYAVDVPGYQVKKALTTGAIAVYSITIGSYNNENVYVLNDSKRYNFTSGIELSKEEDNFM